MNRALATKLGFKKGDAMLILNSPKGYLSDSLKADTKPRPGKQYDFVQLFVASKTDLNKFTPKAISALKTDGLLWFAYPKKTSANASDITRDYGWDAVTKAGFKPMTQIAIDGTWSALRFKCSRPAADIGKRSGDRREFAAVLESPGDGIDGAYVRIPFDVEKVYGKGGHIKVKAWFDGYPYRGILANMGMGCHIIIVRKDIRKAIEKNAGDKIKVELEHDNEERIVEVPEDLKEELSQSVEASDFFHSLSYTNRKEYAVWISSAKKIETREKRLREAMKKLLQKKKNPSAK